MTDTTSPAAASPAPSRPAAEGNSPRESQPSAVTRDHIDQLKAEREQPAQTLDYTIGGSVETAVHSQVAADRERAIASGEQRLQEAKERMQRDAAFAANKGRARAQFDRGR